MSRQRLRITDIGKFTERQREMPSSDLGTVKNNLIYLTTKNHTHLRNNSHDKYQCNAQMKRAFLNARKYLCSLITLQ